MPGTVMRGVQSLQISAILFQAISELGREEVECNVLQSNSELFDLKVAIDENLKRKNLTDPEVAAQIKED